MTRGKFFAIEGIDASGKRTQQDYLVQRLESEGHTAATVDFPQYDSSVFGELVGEMLSGKLGIIENIPPKIASVLYAADRFTTRDMLISNLENGIDVVANRFTLSNGHQAARLPENERPEFVKWLYQMEHATPPKGFGSPIPDLYIHLDVPPETARELLMEKAAREYLGDIKVDLLEANITHQMEAARMYKWLAENIPGITSINCCKADGKLMEKVDIHELIWEKVTASLREDKEGIIRLERE